MPNAKDAAHPAYHKILVVGPGGSGKTSQIWTLPGKKFAYLFDPSALASLTGLDIDYELFLPDAAELDASLKGFNKNSRDDKVSGSRREPTTYMRWVEDMNGRNQRGEFDGYDWLIFDSLTLLATAVMDRQMFINGRFGGIEDLADYRITGAKIAEVFRSILSLNKNIYLTGHLNTFQDDKTKRIDTQLNLPGKARQMLPLLCSNIWEMRPDEKGGYVLFTRAEPRGFQGIRTTLLGLAPQVDVTIKDFKNPERYGIGALLAKSGPKAPLVATQKEPGVEAKPVSTQETAADSASAGA